MDDDAIQLNWNEFRFVKDLNYGVIEVQPSSHDVNFNDCFCRPELTKTEAC